MQAKPRVVLRCRCGRVLDEFRVQGDPTGDPYGFVLGGRTAPDWRGGRYVSSTPGVPDLKLDAQTGSRTHVYKGYVSGQDPEDDPEDPDGVRYRCHADKCGDVYGLLLTDLAAACQAAAQAGRPSVDAAALVEARRQQRRAHHEAEMAGIRAAREVAEAMPPGRARIDAMLAAWDAAKAAGQRTVRL